jgi:hypothetical protein
MQSQISSKTRQDNPPWNVRLHGAGRIGSEGQYWAPTAAGDWIQVNKKTDMKSDEIPQYFLSG